MTCSLCKGECRTREACQLPAQQQRRAPMFRPTYELDGPVRRRRRIGSPWPWLLLTLVLGALSLGLFLYPALRRFF